MARATHNENPLPVTPAWTVEGELQWTLYLDINEREAVLEALARVGLTPEFVGKQRPHPTSFLAAGARVYKALREAPKW